MCVCVCVCVNVKVREKKTVENKHVCYRCRYMLDAKSGVCVVQMWHYICVKDQVTAPGYRCYRCGSIVLLEREPTH